MGAAVGTVPMVTGQWRNVLAKLLASVDTEVVPKIAEVKAGVHYRRLESDLSKEGTRRVLSALQRPEILDLLQVDPLESIVIARLPAKGESAYYDWGEKTVTVNSAGKLGVYYGAAFEPGVTRNMSGATMDKMESMRRALLQELAHHLENVSDGVKAAVKAGYESATRRPITRYAAEGGPQEYFAESFVAYIVEPKVLASYDPNGSIMVKKALAASRKAR